jgi:hypothetical protein
VPSNGKNAYYRLFSVLEDMLDCHIEINRVQKRQHALRSNQINSNFGFVQKLLIKFVLEPEPRE